MDNSDLQGEAAAADAAASSSESRRPGAGGRARADLIRGKTSPYGFFVKLTYQEHVKAYPHYDIPVTEISRRCAEQWQSMNDQQKSKFYQMAFADAERYQAEAAQIVTHDLAAKRKRAKRDPTMPKRSISAFFFFTQARRTEVQAQNAQWSVVQVAKQLGHMWRNASAEERDVFEKLAAEDKKRYAEEMEVWRRSKIREAEAADSNVERDDCEDDWPGPASPRDGYDYVDAEGNALVVSDELEIPWIAKDAGGN